MINRKATIRWKGYDPDDLISGSSKRIWVNCNGCGDGRWIAMYNCYNNINLCQACSVKGENNGMYKKNNPKYDKVDIIPDLSLPKQYIKRLFGLATDGIGIEIDCRLNSKTKNIMINSKFYKISNGGAKNNKLCSTYLGVYIAERILSYIYLNVERMSYSNHGYDFICGNGYKIDVKSACERKNRHGWGFIIKKNTIADYFLCIAFDNRENLNPQHIWLIPGNILNDKISGNISESTLNRWQQYEQPLDKVISCCNIMKESNGDQ